MSTAPLPGAGPAMAAACGAAFLWGTGALVVNLLIERFGLAPETISFWRFVVGAVFLLLVFGPRARWALARRHGLLLLAAGVCMAAYVLAWFLGIERIGAAVPTLIALCLPPVLVTLLAVLRGHDRLDAPLLVWLVTALAGTTLVVTRHGAGAADAPAAVLWAGVGFSVASAVLYAGFTLVSGRLLNALGAGPAAMGLTVVAACAMGLSALYKPLGWPAGVPTEAWLLYLGLVTAALALLAFNWGARRLSPTALTIATLVEPLTAVLLAALLLGQHLTLLQWAGALMMVASITALGLRDARRPARGAHGG